MNIKSYIGSALLILSALFCSTASAEALNYPVHQPVTQTLNLTESMSCSLGSAKLSVQVVYDMEVLSEEADGSLLLELRLRHLEGNASGSAIEAFKLNSSHPGANKNVPGFIADAVARMIDNPTVYEVSPTGEVEMVKGGAVAIFENNDSLVELLGLSDDIFEALVYVQFLGRGKDFRAGQNILLGEEAPGVYDMNPTLRITKIDASGIHYDLQGKYVDSFEGMDVVGKISGHGSWNGKNALLFKESLKTSATMEVAEWGLKARLTASQSISSKVKR